MTFGFHHISLCVELSDCPVNLSHTRMSTRTSQKTKLQSALQGNWNIGCLCLNLEDIPIRNIDYFWNVQLHNF